MPNRIITAVVNGESIKLSNRIAGAAGSHNAVSLALTFDSAWDGTTKKIYFFDTYGKTAVFRVLTADILIDGAYYVPIPSEPLAKAGEMTLTIRGVEMDGETAERIIMSASTTMRVLDALVPNADVAPIEPTPTQTEQLQGQIDYLVGAIGSIPDFAQAAQDGAETATTKAGEASASAISAADSASLALSAVGKTSYIGANGNWYEWRNGAFVDSGIKAQGSKGETGDAGKDGAKGDAATVSVGTTTTGAAGTSATVVNVGTTSAAVLNFTIPRGVDGDGSGDMTAAVYDPNGKQADAFDMDNMVEGLTNKIFSADEKTKLAGISENANNYTHPANHPPSIITQDANNRFVTDVDKGVWNYSEFSSVATNQDDDGTYKAVEWKRVDNTVYARSALIGTAPYGQVKVDYYDTSGTTIIKTITWDLTYDDNEFPYKREVDI